MKKRLLFMDLDGTLLNDEKQIGGILDEIYSP